MHLAVDIRQRESRRLERGKIPVLTLCPWSEVPDIMLLIISRRLPHEPAKLAQIEPGDLRPRYEESATPRFGNRETQLITANAFRFDFKSSRALQIGESDPEINCIWWHRDRRSRDFGGDAVIDDGAAVSCSRGGCYKDHQTPQRRTYHEHLL